MLDTPRRYPDNFVAAPAIGKPVAFCVQVAGGKVTDWRSYSTLFLERQQNQEQPEHL